MSERHYLGVDVGTGSVRAALFDVQGVRRGMGVHPIGLHRPEQDFVEQSSDEIWSAAGKAIRAALAEAGLAPGAVAGIGFDATCSLVVLDAEDRPLSVSPSGKSEHNVIVWMDHRAIRQAEHINAGKHAVLSYVGGAISPEMQMPKLLWLKQHLPATFARAARFLDLPDFLTYRATGSDARSLCSTVCKWTYLGRERRWDSEFLESIGLPELVREGFQRIGTRIRPLGECAGELMGEPAHELGLAPCTPVGISIIDAHAGGLGLLGVPVAGGALDFDARLALIGGTSSCHMAVSPEARFIEGIWGPYYSAMVPNMWLTEGGQSATGALIDHVLQSHVRYPELRERAAASGSSVQALLNERIEVLARSAPFPAALTRELHVYPDFHGNRSPRADPSLRGMISGLRLGDGVDDLALVYYATIQAIAHGTRHIIDAMNARGYRIDTLIACGGDTKNPLFVREHADITACTMVMPREPEAVLLGAAMLGAVAAGAYPSVQAAMVAMNGPSHVSEPAAGETYAFHARKHQVFLRMCEDQLAYRNIIESPPSLAPAPTAP
jgi:FGGY-family pentulose kinase